MLELLELGIDNAIAVRIDGKVSKKEMDIILESMQNKLNDYEEIVIYKQVDSFSGMELPALADEIRYLLHSGFVQMQKISKVALVVDKSWDKDWLKQLVKLENKLLKNMDIRWYAVEDKDKAIDFLRD